MGFIILLSLFLVTVNLIEGLGSLLAAVIEYNVPVILIRTFLSLLSFSFDSVAKITDTSTGTEDKRFESSVTDSSVNSSMAEHRYRNAVVDYF